MWPGRAATTRSGQPEVALEPDGEPGVVAHPAHTLQDARHEADPVERVVPDGQQLTGRTEQDLLMGHEAAKPQRMHGYAVHAGSTRAVGIRGGRVRDCAQPSIRLLYTS